MIFKIFDDFQLMILNILADFDACYELEEVMMAVYKNSESDPSKVKCNNIC